MIQKWSSETMREICDDSVGEEVIEIGPDRDGFGCVEIRLRSEGKIVERLTFQPEEQADLVADAIKACASEMRGKNK